MFVIKEVVKTPEIKTITQCSLFDQLHNKILPPSADCYNPLEKYRAMSVLVNQSSNNITFGQQSPKTIKIDNKTKDIEINDETNYAEFNISVDDDNKQIEDIKPAYKYSFTDPLDNNDISANKNVTPIMVDTASKPMH